MTTATSTRSDSGALDARQFGRRVIILSPHLDDAVFSLGATISRMARAGVRVTIVTVFSGDPTSEIQGGPWDRLTGFRTAGEAAMARRLEDQRACSLVGANPVWGSFHDAQYEHEWDERLAISDLAGVLPTADLLLLPGFPLVHPDHARITLAVIRSGVSASKVGLYAELPYALWSGPVRIPETLRGLVSEPLGWQGTRVGVRDVLRKMRACSAYASQVPCFRERIVWRMTRHEVLSRHVIALLE
jgi:LmbE family N-acetylglucosaminyl deacetylase